MLKISVSLILITMAFISCSNDPVETELGLGYWEKLGSFNFAPASMGPVAINSSGHIFATFYMGSSADVYRSVDNGNTWELIAQEYAQWVPAIFISSTDDIYFENTRSVDNGDNWDVVAYDILYPERFLDERFLDMEENSMGQLYIRFGGGRSFTSIDGGETWDSMSLPGYDIAINDDDDIFACGGYYDVDEERYYAQFWRSYDNGASWEESTFDLATGLSGIGINQNGYIFCYGGSSIYRSTDDGDSWERVYSGVIEYWGGDIICNNGYVFASVGHEYLLVSEDNGQHWRKVGMGLLSSCRYIALSPDGHIYTIAYDNIAHYAAYRLTLIEPFLFGRKY